MEASLVLNGGRGVTGLRRRLLKARKRALTLIEAAMVLGLFAFIVGAAMYYYGQSNSNRQVTNGLGELASVQQAVRSLYAGQSDFSGVSAGALTDTNALPKRMVLGAGNIRGTFGKVDVASDDAGGGVGTGYSITFNNVPVEACSKMIAQDLGRGLYSVKAGSQTRQQGATPPPFTPADAALACKGTASNTVKWIFN